MRPTPRNFRTPALLAWGLFLVALLLGGPALAQDPVVTSAVPDMAEQATYDLVVTISGSNFGTDSVVDFYVTGTTDPGGITVKKVRRRNPKTLEATIDVAADAQTQYRFDIQVRTGGRTGKGTELFKVLVKRVGTADPAITYVLGGARDRVMVCNADGGDAVALYTGGRDRNVHWPRLAPRDPAEPGRGEVLFVESRRGSWENELKRVRFAVVNGFVSVAGVDALVPLSADSIVTPPVLSPDGSEVFFIRGGEGAAGPRIQALSLTTLVETTVCGWQPWGSGWPEPDCAAVPPDWPEWVLESLLGLTPSGASLLLQESNWIPDSRLCPQRPVLVRYTALDLGVPWGNHLCERAAVYEPSADSMAPGTGETARTRSELAIGTTVEGLSGIFLADYGLGTPPVLVPGTEGGDWPSWSCDESKLVYTVFDGHGYVLKVVTLPAGPTSTIVASGGGPHWGRCP